MKQVDFEALLGDPTKRIVGEINWIDDEDHSPAMEFRVDVGSAPGYPIFIKGSCNRLATTVSYALVHRGSGRIYSLDVGKEHHNHNPDCEYIGEVHKHRWNEPVRDKQAYVPKDITAPVTDPVSAWRQFCVEANIQHDGVMHQPPPLQLEIFMISACKLIAQNLGPLFTCSEVNG